MSKLKVHLQKLDKHIIFQILEQNISLPYNGGVLYNVDIGNDKRVNFLSVNTPQISINGNHYNRSDRCEKNPFNGSYVSIDVYLRGSSFVFDYDVVIIPFHNNKTRNRVYNDLSKAFKKLKEYV